jgi:hypothetical protein
MSFHPTASLLFIGFEPFAVGGRTEKISALNLHNRMQVARNRTSTD